MLRAVLSRLSNAGYHLRDALVVSHTDMALPESERRSALGGLLIELSRVPDLERRAAMLQREQRTIGSTADASGGNTTKRLLLVVELPALTTSTDLESLLSKATAMGRVSSELLDSVAVHLHSGNHFDAQTSSQARVRVMR